MATQMLFDDLCGCNSQTLKEILNKYNCPISRCMLRSGNRPIALHSKDAVSAVPHSRRQAATNPATNRAYKPACSQPKQWHARALV